MARLWMTLFEDGKVAVTTSEEKMDKIVSEEWEKNNGALGQKQFRSGVAEGYGEEVYDSLEDPDFPYKQ